MAELNEEVMQKIMGMEEENRVLETGIEPLYTAIGRNYYEKPEGYEKEMEHAADQLDAIKKKMHENHIEVLALKGIRLCPNCGSEVEQGAIFCGECGIRIEAVKEVDENSVLCSRCGAKNERGKKFCVICGQRLVDIIKAAQEESGQNMKWLDERASDEIGFMGEAAATIEKNGNIIINGWNDNAATGSVGAGVADNIEVPKNIEEVGSIEEVENIEGAENIEKAENIEGAESIEEVENIEGAENIEKAENIEGAESIEEAENIEGAENIKEAENIERAENIEEEENIAGAEDINVAGNAGVPQEGVIFCPNCGNELPADALFCGECGVRIVEEMPEETQKPVGDMPLYCTECGAKLSPGVMSCTECGTPVQALI